MTEGILAGPLERRPRLVKKQRRRQQRPTDTQ